MDHFKGKPRALRQLFNAYLALVRTFGPVTVIPQGTRIAFQGRVRFAGCTVQRTALKGGLWLKRRVDSPLFTSMQQVTAHDWIYTFRLAGAGDLQHPELDAFLREAYEIGAQRHPMQQRSRGSARPTPA